MLPRLAFLLAALLLAPLAAPPEAAAKDPLRILVWKSRHELALVRGERVIRRYRVSLGLSPVGRKETRGDRKTPSGTYFIHEKRPSERFHRFLALSYPGVEDAERAFTAGRIDASTWADIWLAAQRRQAPPWNTPLGGFVGIHGTGGTGAVQAKLRQVWDWTDGCIALSDRDVEELFDAVPVGTAVEIHE